MHIISIFRFTPIMLTAMAFMAIAAPVLGQSSFFAQDIPLDTSLAMASIDAIAVNSQGEYLVLWQVEAGGGNTDIFARRAWFHPDFQWLGDVFAIANSDRPEHTASVAYNAQDDEFLVLYEFAFSADDSDIRAQRVQGAANVTPNLIGGMLPVAITTEAEKTPDIAYNRATGQYLAVYEMDDEIWGRRIARRGQGDNGGDFLGDEFPIVTADAPSSTPAVAAASHEGYFLVAYSYAFSPDDDDLRAQRVRGRPLHGEELLNGVFILAETQGREGAPDVAYSGMARAFIILWQNDFPANDDIAAAWVDAGNYTNDPIIGSSFPVSAQPAAQEQAPRVSVDAQTGATAVIFSYADGIEDWSRPALAWLNHDPHATPHVLRPVQALPERPFVSLGPRIHLWGGQPHFLAGYTRRWGASAEADRDAWLLAASRAGVALPIIMQ